MILVDVMIDAGSWVIDASDAEGAPLIAELTTCPGGVHELSRTF